STEVWSVCVMTLHGVPKEHIMSSEVNIQASTFLLNGPTRIGSVYKKAVYRQYTDESYSTEIPKPAWLGFLGPILRAEVGDVIEVQMKNFARRPYSLHPHGVFYEKNSEGALYPDGTTGRDKRDDAVAPGESYTYTWQVKPEYAPTEADASCLTWIYHSHGDAPKDIASGLIGALLTCKKGTLDISQKRSDVDEDFILMFSVVDENLSWYLEENIKMFCSDKDATNKLKNNTDEEFRESNLMHCKSQDCVSDVPCLGISSACLSYLYYSAVDPVRDTNSGLFGPIQVCKKGVFDGSGHQHADKIQHEFFLLFSVMDENESWYLEENIEKFGSSDSSSTNEEFQESNKMHAVNGLMYGNLEGLDLCNGEHVMWHILGLGTEMDIHGVFFEGNTFRRDGMNRDTLSVFPHTTVTVSMTPDNDGQFELSCRTGEHYEAGMRQHYEVKACSTVTPAAEHFSSTVWYYIAAEEVEWNYAPNRTWELEKHNTTLEESPGSVFLEQSENLIGGKYKKVVFREYIDETFTKRKPRHPEEEHLEIMGPIIRAEVGERIQVVFKNNARRPYSIHAHGVKTSKTHQDGHMLTYNWTIPKRSGPGPSDPNCITFAYYSSVSLVKDLMSGLVGPLIVCHKNILNSDRRRKDIDKEFALLFMVFDENESHYLDENIKTYLNADPEKFDKYDGDFMESNKMHGINGKMYANLHGLNMTENDKTEWYLIGLGNEVDMHTVHFHAQSFTYKMNHSHRADVYDLFPGTFQTIELTAGSPGQWLLHCHVTDHIHAGMETIFTVHPKERRGVPHRNGAKHDVIKILGQ
uniref:ferroxidase n=1 Tax=Sinocyclocheilus grahami TaxID=75366 RepID=A0A672PML9_SINGR